jgi:hypothetical protein
VTTKIKGKTTASEVARSHDLTIGKVEQWKADFIHHYNHTRPHQALNYQTPNQRTKTYAESQPEHQYRLSKFRGTTTSCLCLSQQKIREPRFRFVTKPDPRFF